MTRKSILFADDVDIFLASGKACFQEDEFDVHTACNGEEALNACRTLRPDIAFLDLHMPIMSGVTCCRRIREHEELSRMPVVMMLGGMREYDLRTCREAGCSDVLEKPVNRQRIQDMARRLLNIRNRRDIRYEARLQVRYGVDQAEVLSNYSINLSTGGLFLETTSPFPEGTCLRAEFELPDCGTVVSCRARVAWVNHPDMIVRPHLDSGMGLQFIDMTMNDMDNIRQFIRGNNLAPAW
jgi:uncharacterized protein (TIGR02266 family)